MKNNHIDQKMIIDSLIKAIKNKDIPINLEQPAPIQQIIETRGKKSFYEANPVSVFDAFTLLLFSLNILNLIDISWILVFLSMLFPYILLGLAWSISKIIIKIKTKNIKNKKK